MKPATPARVAVGIEYCGRNFSGWQRDPGKRTVQGCVEQALSAVAGGEPVRLLAAGRTDAGVHAACQVAHFTPTVQRSPRAWTLGANGHLPGDVALLWARPVGTDFHARYSATGRCYRYLVLNRPARAGLWTGRVAWEPRPLNEHAMRRAARLLLGRHDFSAFRAADCQAASPVRTLRRLAIRRLGAVLILEVVADGFLQKMVRNIAGVLLMVGTGDRLPAWAGQVLQGRDRARAGITAPPGGLYLADIYYPSRFGLPRPRPGLCSMMPGLEKLHL